MLTAPIQGEIGKTYRTQYYSVDSATYRGMQSGYSDGKDRYLVYRYVVQPGQSYTLDFRYPKLGASYCVSLLLEDPFQAASSSVPFIVSSCGGFFTEGRAPDKPNWVEKHLLQVASDSPGNVLYIRFYYRAREDEPVLNPTVEVTLRTPPDSGVGQSALMPGWESVGPQYFYSKFTDQPFRLTETGTATGQSGSAGVSTVRLEASAIVSTLPEGCPATPAPVSTFLSSDARLYLWLSVSGAKVGDIASSEWYDPTGRIYTDGVGGPWSALTEAGTFCFREPFPIAGAAATRLLGTWTVRVTWNARVLTTLTFTLKSPGAADPPVIVAAAVNGASFAGGISSGSWVVIAGTGLATTSRSWQNSDIVNGRLPTQLDGTSVTINGKPAYVAFIDPRQVNVLAPEDSATGPVTVRVVSPRGTSNSFVAEKRRVSPGLFTLSAENGRYAVAFHADGRLVGKPGLIAGLDSAPAVPGETIVLYGTGFGPTQPALTPGVAVSSPAGLASPARVYFGDTRAEEVSYAGAIFNGVYQVNVKVPGLSSSGDVAIAVEVDGERSQSGLFVTTGR